MRRLIPILVLSFLAAPVFSLQAWEAECMVPGGKFSPCAVDVLEEGLAVRYAKEEYQNRNRQIPAERIRQVTQGKSEQHDAQKSFVFGPLMFLRLFDREKDRGGMFGIDYLNEKGKLQYLLIRIPSDQVYTFGTSLKKIR